MADGNRHGELIWSEKGKFWDLENGEKGYHACTRRMLAVEDVEEDGLQKFNKAKEQLEGKSANA
jgi:hypothetical protein